MGLGVAAVRVGPRARVKLEVAERSPYGGERCARGGDAPRRAGHAARAVCALVLTAVGLCVVASLVIAVSLLLRPLLPALAPVLLVLPFPDGRRGQQVYAAGARVKEVRRAGTARQPHAAGTAVRAAWRRGTYCPRRALLGGPVAGVRSLAGSGEGNGGGRRGAGALGGGHG